MRSTLHLVRATAQLPDAVAERDSIVYLQSMELVRPGEPPTPIDHDQLLALVFRADLVVTW